jgi:hypothetical protein
MCNGMRKSRSKYLNLGNLCFDEKTTQGYRKTENHKKQTLHAERLLDGHGLGKQKQNKGTKHKKSK